MKLYTDPVCSCGSGKIKYPISDGYGIFLCYCCEDCELTRLDNFRSDIMERYDMNESLNED